MSECCFQYQIRDYHDVDDWENVPSALDFGISASTARRIAEHADSNSAGELFTINYNNNPIERVVNLRRGSEKGWLTGSFVISAEPTMVYYAKRHRSDHA